VAFIFIAYKFINSIDLVDNMSLYLRYNSIKAIEFIIKHLNTGLDHEKRFTIGFASFLFKSPGI
jgi:hypothetical protein